MPLLTLIFAGWLLVMFLRGWFRGFWSMLAGLLALVAAYALAIALAPVLAPRFEAIGVPPAFSVAVAATAVWMLSTLVLTFTFKLLVGPLARREGWLGNLGGGLVGVAFGAVTGLFAVWGYSFVKTMLDENTAYVSETSPLEGVAAGFVSRLTEAGMSASGASEAMRDLAAAAMRQPGKLMNNARELAKTPALQELMQDPEAQALMRAGDSEALQETEAFKKLMGTPEAESLLSTLVEKSQSTDEFMEDKLAAISIKVQEMRDNPEAIALAQDPEVIALVEQENPWKILSHPKIQKLWKILSENKPTLNINAREENAEPARSEDATYRWVDDDGTVHYSDQRAIPASKRESAEEI